ncbi:MAG: hypothetical protein H7318_20650 [Oligoflexus sp.]|nr:hypothetical protein [Oligoflexus sp.]
MKRLLIGCVFLGACTTPTSPKTFATAIQEKVAIKDQSVMVTLVKAEEAKRYAHLKKHIGQLMLANADTQVLLPAAPPLSTGQNYFALVSKVYRRENKEWLAIPWLPSLEIKMLGKPGDALQLIGQDIVQETGNGNGNGSGPVTIHAFFRQKNSGAADAQLILSIQPDQARIDVKVKAVGTVAKIPWSLRVGRGSGEDHSIPFKGTQVAGLTSSLLPHAVSIVGEQPFTLKQDESFSYLEAAPSSPGFKILLARDALLKQVELVQTLSACYTKAANCKASNVPSNSRKLSSPAAKKGETALWQAAMVYNKEGFRSLVPIREGETLDLPIAAKEKLVLLFADAEGVLQKIELSAKVQSPIVLPPMRKGSLQINLKPSEAAFLEIRSAVQKDGKSLHAWVSDADSDRILSPNTILQVRWPLQMSLPAGDYHLRINDGYQIYCDQRLTVLVDRKTNIECLEPKSAPDFSVRASISIDRAAVPEQQIAATGIRVITSSEKPKDRDPLLAIPMLAAYDSELGLSMRSFPSSAKMEKAWNAFVHEKPDRSTLTHFSEFVRQQDKGASLVLDCPPPGFQLAEYNWIVQSLKPDVLEVFGCQQPELSEDLLQVANRLQQKQNRAVRIAAASFSGSLVAAGVPALYLPRVKRSQKLETAQVIDDLKEGRYTLGFRSELLIPAIHAFDNQIQLGIRTSDLQKRDVVVRIYDQDEKLSEEGFTLGDRFENEVTVKLALKSTSRWLRIELLTREIDSLEDGPLFILATSNFFGLDGKLER